MFTILGIILGRIKYLLYVSTMMYQVLYVAK